jgi:hypothetical protein
MNELSAKSAAAIQKREKDELPPAHRAQIADDAIGHGRIDEVQLLQLLTAQRDGVESSAIASFASQLGVKQADPALAAALAELRAPYIVVDPSGNRLGLWSKPFDVREFSGGR